MLYNNVNNESKEGYKMECIECKEKIKPAEEKYKCHICENKMCFPCHETLWINWATSRGYDLKTEFPMKFILDACCTKCCIINIVNQTNGTIRHSNWLGETSKYKL